MGGRDLRAMRAGRMDPTGESTTQIGYVLGIIGTILFVIQLVAVCLWLAVVGAVLSQFPQFAPTPKRQVVFEGERSGRGEERPGWGGGERNAGGGSGLTLKVTKVEKSDRDFLVHMTATNHTKDKLGLPVFKNFYVVDDLGNQYEAEPFASTFPDDVAPGATVSGYAAMTKPLNGQARTLKVTFTTVFGSFAVDSAVVEGVPVR
jgi:hypothetical protein